MRGRGGLGSGFRKLGRDPPFTDKNSGYYRSNRRTKELECLKVAALLEFLELEDFQKHQILWHI